MAIAVIARKLGIFTPCPGRLAEQRKQRGTTGAESRPAAPLRSWQTLPSYLVACTLSYTPGPHALGVTCFHASLEASRND